MRGWLKEAYLFGGGKPMTHSLQRTALDWLTNKSGIKVTGHDLRRTYLTVAESLDLSPYTYKRLVGHKIRGSNDVTAGYIVPEKDRLRRAANLICNQILEFACHAHAAPDDGDAIGNTVN